MRSPGKPQPHPGRLRMELRFIADSSSAAAASNSIEKSGGLLGTHSILTKLGVQATMRWCNLVPAALPAGMA